MNRSERSSPGDGRQAALSTTFIKNIDAILKLGAQFEGIIRRDMLRPDGLWRDTAVHSILIDEWPDVRAGLERRLAAFEGTTVTFDAATGPAAE